MVKLLMLNQPVPTGGSRPVSNQVLFGFLNAGEDLPEKFLVLRLVKVLLDRLSGTRRSLHRLAPIILLLLLLRLPLLLPEVAAPQQLVVLHLQGAVLGVHLVEQRDPAVLHHLGAAHAGALVVVDPVERIGRLRRPRRPLAVPALQGPGDAGRRRVPVALLVRGQEHGVGQQAADGVRPGGPGGGVGFPELAELLGLALQLSRSGLKKEFTAEGASSCGLSFDLI